MKPSPRLVTILRRLLLGVATLATLLAVFVVVENWRGDRAWAAVDRELKAKGESLDFATFQPPAVPDDQNFFKAPLLSRILYLRPDDAEQKKLLAESHLMDFHVLGSFRSTVKDFAALRDALKKSGRWTAPFTESAAADVLVAMQPMQPLLDAVRDAARLRPHAALERFSTQFERFSTFSADEVFRTAQALGVRAAAEVELGRIDDAYADIFALQRMANALSTHPATLLNHLVGVAMHGLAAGVISDGCQRHLWSDARLAKFQSLLDGLQPLAAFRDAIRVERAGVVSVVDSRTKSTADGFNWPWWLFHGWVQQNKVVYCQRLDAELLSSFTANPDRIHTLHSAPAKREKLSAVAMLLSPFQVVSRLGISNLGSILAGLGTSAENLRLASIAWSLERHRLARNRNPESLAELVPAFLPAVPIGIFDGQPFRYLKLPDGGHKVYALGQNGRDDGGKDDDIVLSLPDVK